MRFAPIGLCTKTHKLEFFTIGKVYRNLLTHKLVAHCDQCRKDICIIPVRPVSTLMDIFLVAGILVIVGLGISLGRILAQTSNPIKPDTDFLAYNKDGLVVEFRSADTVFTDTGTTLKKFKRYYTILTVNGIVYYDTTAYHARIVGVK